MPMICNYNSPDSPLPCCSSWCWLIGMTREWEFALSTFCLKISRNSTCLTSFRTGNQRNLFTGLHKVRPSFYWITGIVWYTVVIWGFTHELTYIYFFVLPILKREHFTNSGGVHSSNQISNYSCKLFAKPIKLVCFILFTVKLRPVSNKCPVSIKCPGGHMLFSGSAPSPISTPLPRRIPISAHQNLLYKLLSLRHLWKEAPNTLSLQLFLDQQ